MVRMLQDRGQLPSPWDGHSLICKRTTGHKVGTVDEVPGIRWLIGDDGR